MPRTLLAEYFTSGDPTLLFLVRADYEQPLARRFAANEPASIRMAVAQRLKRTSLRHRQSRASCSCGT